MAIKIPPHVALLILFLCLPFLVRSVKDNKDNKDDPRRFKGMFVFGSSLVDNGNNNFLEGSKLRVDYSPYGIDFPDGVTGRFTNGKNVIDLLSEQLKLPAFTPPFLNSSTKGSKIINGVNFASGGSGILGDTGFSIVGKVMSLNEQINNFEKKILPELEAQVGQKGPEFLSHYLFVVGAGGNDFTLNYFQRPVPFMSLNFFTAKLIVSLSHQLKKLYDLGGRKFIMTSVYPIGCNPSVMNQVTLGKVCVLPPNMAARLFNSKLKTLVDDLKHQLSGSELILINCYKIVRDIIRAPYTRGFEETKKTCCEVPRRIQGGDGFSCKRGGKVCENRNKYVFFDGVHPTEAVNIQIATKAFSSDNPSEVYPFNISRLASFAF